MGTAWEESGEEKLWIFHGNFGDPSTETAPKHPGVCPHLVPGTPCMPLASFDFPSCPCGLLLLVHHCHSADCAADLGHPGAAFSSLVIRES